MAKKAHEDSAPRPGGVTSEPTSMHARWSTPAEWRWARIADVGTVKLGRQLAANRRRGTLSTPYIRAANITTTGLDLSEVLRMDLTEQERESLKLMPGDVLLSEASGSPAHVGKSAMWNDELPDCCFQNTVIRFRPHALLPEYALLLFRYFLAAGIFARAAHGVGIQHLGASRLSQMEVPVPSMAEQARIVGEVNRRLGEVAAAEVSLKSAIKSIDEQLSILLEAAVTGDIDDPVRELQGIAEPVDRQHAETDISQFARISIPESWSWSTVGRAGEAKKGKVREPRHERGENLMPYLRVANVHECRIDGSDLQIMNFTPEEQTVYLLKDGDILLNEGQSPNLVGRPAIYRGEPPRVCFQNTLLRFRPGALVSSEYALLVFRHYLRAGVFEAASKWTTNLAHLGLQRFSELPFPLPPRAEQDRLVSIAQEKEKQLETQRASIVTSLSNVEQMRREVLTAAVRGELTSRTASEETAEDMLARLGRPPKEPRQVRPPGTPSADLDEEAEGERQLDLTDTLRQLGGRATAEELFTRAGYDRDLTSEVEGFYLALRESLGKTIQEDGSEQGRTVLKVIQDAT